MGKRQDSSSKPVWSIPAGDLNANITAFDKALQSACASSSAQFFEAFRLCPGYAHATAAWAVANFYLHSAAACIILGEKRVWSIAQSREFWHQPTSDEDLLVRARYTEEDFAHAADLNGNGSWDWRLVFYSGLSVKEQVQKVPQSFVHNECLNKLHELDHIAKPAPGLYLVNMNGGFVLDNERHLWRTPGDFNELLARLGGPHEEIVPLPIFTEALLAFSSRGLPVMENKQYFTGNVWNDPAHGLRKLSVWVTNEGLIQLDDNMNTAANQGRVPYAFVMRKPGPKEV